MTKPIETVRRTANISREDALKGLLAKFPNHDIISFTEEKTPTLHDFVAQLQVKGEFGAGAEGGGELDKLPLSPEDEAGEEKPDALDAPGDIDELDSLTDDEGEGGVEGKLDEVLDLLHEMIHGPGEGAPHDEAGPTGGPVPGPAGGPSELPAPVKPQNSLGMGGPQHAFAHMASKRHFVVEAEAPGQSLKSAVLELNRALAATGHRVAKIQRRGSKIIAGVTKTPGA